MAEGQRVVVGMDVGATKVLAGYVDEAGRVLRQARSPMDRSNQDAALWSIEAALEALMSAPWEGPAPLAVGFGVVGQTDPATATWVRAMNIPIHTSVDMTARFTARYGLPAAVDNDVHAATLAELRWGAGRGAREFIYLNVGTGVAAGLVCNGQLVRGAANYAGELGHMAVAGEDILCPCGRRGCLEPVASGGGMIQRARDLLPTYPDSALGRLPEGMPLDAHAIFTYAEAGDPLAQRLASEAVEALGKALVNLINLLNPEIIVVGGGVFADGWLLPRLRAVVERDALSGALRTLRGIHLSTLQPDLVGLLGAAVLAWDRIAS